MSNSRRRYLLIGVVGVGLIAVIGVAALFLRRAGQGRLQATSTPIGQVTTPIPGPSVTPGGDPTQSAPGQLAAHVYFHLDSQLDLALLLGVEAARHETTFAARTSLFSALGYSPHLHTFLRGHTQAVTSVAFSPDGRTLAWDVGQVSQSAYYL